MVHLQEKISLLNLDLFLNKLLETAEGGLTLDDILNISFFIVFVRFIILAIRFNLKTSFFITSIGFIAGGIWFFNLKSLIFTYRGNLLNYPLLLNFAEELNNEKMLSETDINVNISQLGLTEQSATLLTSPLRALGNSYASSITYEDIDKKQYYIDPISMIVSKLELPPDSRFYKFYYQLWNYIIPKLFSTLCRFYSQLRSITLLVLIVRVGKRYCPYLIRWHWTCIFLSNLVDTVLVSTIRRWTYFNETVLSTKLTSIYIELEQTFPDSQFKEALDNHPDYKTLELQHSLVTSLIGIIIMLQIGFSIFGMFHAICGQYFYLPFFIKNVELHVGPRPDTIYSGGYTSWQDPIEETNFKKFPPKIWFGWFGRGTQNQKNLHSIFQRVGKKLADLVRKIIRRIKKILL